MKKMVLTGLLVACTFHPVIIIAEEKSPLEIAFQKEYAFLDLQRKSMVKQSRELMEINKNKNILLATQLNKLKNQLANLEVDVENGQALLEASTLSLELKREDQNRLDQLFDQANASLDVKIEDFTSVLPLYHSAINMITETNKLRHESGEYFLSDGRKVNGAIIHVGRIASYAIGESGSGMLVPTGEGKLKIWKPENVKTALALNSGSMPETIKLFLYEDENQAIEESKDKTIQEIVNSGGIIAWIIVLTGGIAIIMILLRIFFLKRASKGTEKLMKEIKKLIRSGQLKSAIAICEKQRGAAARVVTSTLRNLDRDRDHLEDIVAESILHENAYLNRYGAAILVVAAVAPLMGLLGTVTGMIETFDIITQFGTGDPKLLSVGISTALVTTQLGLIVAIPALISGNLLSGWSNKIKDNMEQAALGVINLHGIRKNIAANDECITQTVAA